LKSVNDVGSPGKRGKRYDPYSSGPPKRARKNKNQASSGAEQLPAPQPLGSAAQHPPVYADPNAAGIGHPHYSQYGMPSYYQTPSAYPHHHVYSTNSYPQQVSPSPPNAPQQPSQTPPAPQHSVYTYTPPPVASGVEPQQPAQQPYQYQYYPPPPRDYSYPPTATWPYPGYPPQQPGQQPVSTGAATAATELGGKSAVNDEHDPDGVEDGQTSP